MNNWNKRVVSQSFLVSIILNELFPGTVSDAGFCSFTMIVTQNYFFVNIVSHLLFQISFYQFTDSRCCFLLIYYDSHSKILLNEYCPSLFISNKLLPGTDTRCWFLLICNNCLVSLCPSNICK